jgi:hypothetical protein
MNDFVFNFSFSPQKLHNDEPVNLCTYLFTMMYTRAIKYIKRRVTEKDRSFQKSNTS